MAALEQDMGALRAGVANVEEAPVPGPVEASPPSGGRTYWPHMIDNVFLGLATLLAAHWVATTLPAGNHAVFRLVALAVALPFGLRFERNARSDTSGQVIAALGFGCSGTLAIGLLDMLLGGRSVPSPTAQDIVASVAAITLSHFAGSAWASLRRTRAERTSVMVARSNSTARGATESLLHIQPAQIKGTAEAVKALYEAAAPLAAGGAALWAAFSHTLF